MNIIIQKKKKYYIHNRVLVFSVHVTCIFIMITQSSRECEGAFKSDNLRDAKFWLWIWAMLAIIFDKQIEPDDWLWNV
jgi:hypothetical protein